MTINMKYIIIFIILLTAEMIYFCIADKFNIIDKPNQRSSHSSIRDEVKKSTVCSKRLILVKRQTNLFR